MKIFSVCVAVTIIGTLHCGILHINVYIATLYPVFILYIRETICNFTVATCKINDCISHYVHVYFTVFLQGRDFKQRITCIMYIVLSGNCCPIIVTNMTILTNTNACMHISHFTTMTN